MNEREELAALRRLAELEAKASGSAPKAAPKTEERSTLNNVASGVASGFADLGDTLLNVGTYLPGKAIPAVKQWNDERSASLQAFNDERKDSTAFNVTRVGGNVAATLPVGGVLGAGLKAVAPAATGLINAVTTSGMRAGANPGALNMLTRMAGGATTGGAATALISPEDAGTGAIIGAALPPALSGTGRVSNAIGRALSGPAVPQGVQQSVASARSAGYVIPPSQAKPTLLNRSMEGFAGKLTTAQNASAKNQPISNELVKKAIGASELSEAGLAEVRRNANAAYAKLAGAGAIKTDDAYREAIQKAGAQSAKFADDFPELVSKDVDSLLGKFTGKESFDAESAIEAIKRLRQGQRAGMKAFDDAEKKALAKVQGKIAAALEEVVERNLEKSGSTELLSSFRDARKTLAKVYDVEKALNATTGNIDASKLAASLKKGSPMTGELRQVAEFAGQFPKAAQATEKMGSLPQISPLDFGVGAIGTAAGNPLAFLLGPARMAARAGILTGPVQNSLTKPGGTNKLTGLLTNPAAEQLLYRSSPGLSSSR